MSMLSVYVQKCLYLKKIFTQPVKKQVKIKPKRSRVHVESPQVYPSYSKTISLPTHDPSSLRRSNSLE